MIAESGRQMSFRLIFLIELFAVGQQQGKRDVKVILNLDKPTDFLWGNKIEVAKREGPATCQFVSGAGFRKRIPEAEGFSLASEFNDDFSSNKIFSAIANRHSFKRYETNGHLRILGGFQRFPEVGSEHPVVAVKLVNRDTD